MSARERTDSPEMLGLEQSCQRPGHWLIEGYDVKHVKGARRARKWNTGEWHITRASMPEPVVVRTLTDARDYIRGTQ